MQSSTRVSSIFCLLVSTLTYISLDSPVDATRLFEDENCQDKVYNSSVEGDQPYSLHSSLNTSWRWKIVREQMKNADYEIPEKSVDSKMSIINYVLSASVPINPDPYEFDLEPKLDEQFELAAAQADGVDEELCGQQLIRMLSIMEELQEIAQERRLNSSSTRRTEERHLRLARVLDAYGKYGPGVMAGRARFLGSHSQCVDSQLVLGDDASLTDMRYCVAKLRADKHLDPALRAMPKDPYQPDTVLSVAICVPKSCHTKSFRKHRDLFKRLVDSQFKLPTSVYIDEHLELDSVFCLLDDSPLDRIPPSGHLLIAVLVVWFSLVICATFFKSQQNSGHLKPWQQHLFSALDLQSSWSDFIGKKEISINLVKPSRINLNSLNSFKVIALMVVVYGHGLAFFAFNNLNPLRAYGMAEVGRQLIRIMSPQMLIDSFFVITGLLTAFITLQTFSSSRTQENTLVWLIKKSLTFFLFRYSRLIPLYFLMFWYKKSIFNYLGSGPSWDYGYNRKTAAGSCRLESWLTPFTAQALFQPLAKQCIPQAWSIAGDIFYSIALSPIIALLSKKPIHAAVIASIICLLSNLAMLSSLHSLSLNEQDDLRQSKAHGFGLMVAKYSYIYISPIYRVSSVLIGMLAGFALYHYDQNRTLKEWPDWFKGPITKLSILILILVPVLPTQVFPYKNYVSLRFFYNAFALAMTINRLIWALANAVIFLRLVTDWKDSFIGEASTGIFWKAMVRLNYAILLVHNEVINYDLMSQEPVKMFSLYNVWVLFCTSYLVSLFISLPIHIIIENPLNKLIKSLIKEAIDSGNGAQKLKQKSG